MNKRMSGVAWLSIVLAGALAWGQNPQQSPAFRWVNPLGANDVPGLKHATFRSPSMQLDVGYCIYLPPGYEAADQAAQRYPVVYYLHGGRPGSETKSVKLARHVHEAMAAGDVPPAIYVFVNGGPVSHYNLPEREHSMGEDVFVKELIPHVDATYRTIAERRGRALEGFSQGGRGTARIIFRHPELFCSAAAGGGGHATEKRIAENDGYENDSLRFAPGYNTWDLAREFAKRPEPMPRLLIFVGDQDFNYEANLDYMQHLQSLAIPFERMVVPGVRHNAELIYGERGRQIMQFHAASFRQANP
jgi:S-formylglutathione hydrolase FrmB